MKQGSQPSVEKKQICELCHEPIVDRYYLIVGDLMCLHEHCLRCTVCSRLIDDEQKKCFYRDGKFYCASPECLYNHIHIINNNNNNSSNQVIISSDTSASAITAHTTHGLIENNDDCFYDSLSSSSSSSSSSISSVCLPGRRVVIPLASPQRRPSCQKCSRPIEHNQYFIKLNAYNLVYHIDCFRCARCMCRIESGCLYGLVQNPNTSSDEVLCQNHYRLTYETNHHSQSTGCSMTSYNNMYRLKTSPESLSSSSSSSSSSDHQSDLNNLENRTTIETTSTSNSSSSSLIKPKQLETIVTTTTPNKFQIEPTTRSSTTTTVPISKTPTTNNSNDTTSSVSTANVETTSAITTTTTTTYHNSHRKKKRVRTSFKHQQLRMMKAHFQINQNPDSKELKELSERTGLQKRVLQVWFQNSRAKQRKFSSMLSSPTVGIVDLGATVGRCVPSGLSLEAAAAGGASSVIAQTGGRLVTAQQQHPQQNQQQQTSSVGDEEELDDDDDDDDGDDEEGVDDHDDNYSDDEHAPSDSTATSEYYLDYYEPILR